MATYSKNLKSIEIHTLFSGDAIPIEDTVTDAVASRALDDFMHYRTMNFRLEMEGNVMNFIIPYHAVQYIVVTNSTDEVTRDPYGCDDDSQGE